MKKYFISFRYFLDGRTGFANTFRTSLNKVTAKEVENWEKEILQNPKYLKVVILYFCEVK